MFGKAISYKIKGVTAILVICFHLTFSIIDLPIYRKIFGNIGYLCVGVFFFISGYGIVLKLNTEQDYFKTYIKKKIPRILVPYLEIFIVYWIAFKIMKTPGMSVKRVLLSLIDGHSIVEYSWYVYALILFDFCACLIWKCAKRRKAEKIFLLILIYCWGIYISEWGGNHWTRSCGAYLFGIVCAYYPCVIHYIFKYKNSILLMCIIEVIIGQCMVESVGIYPLHMVISWLNCICLTIIIMYASKYMETKGKIFVYLGKISYEIYLIHGLVILLFRNTKWSLNPSWFMILCTIVSSIILASIWNWFNQKMWVEGRK